MRTAHVVLITIYSCGTQYSTNIFTLIIQSLQLRWCLFEGRRSLSAVEHNNLYFSA